MDDEELARQARRRLLIGVVLTAIMIVTYFGFIAVVAFAKPTAGTLLLDNRVSVGILLGAAVIVLAPVLTWIYVRLVEKR